MRIKHLNLQRGVAAVELGLLLVPLIWIVFGISEYGRAFYEYNTIVKNARSAARYLTLVAPGNTTEITKAKNLVVYGNTTGGTKLVAGLSISNVYVCDSKVSDGLLCKADEQAMQFTGSGNVNLVKVMVKNVTFASLVPGLVPGLDSGLVFGPISLTMAQVQ